MASYKIIKQNESYLTIEVLFADNVFRQLIYSTKTGPELDADLCEYANTYEREYLMITGEGIEKSLMEV